MLIARGNAGAPLVLRISLNRWSRIKIVALEKTKSAQEGTQSRRMGRRQRPARPGDRLPPCLHGKGVGYRLPLKPANT